MFYFNKQCSKGIFKMTYGPLKHISRDQTLHLSEYAVSMRKMGYFSNVEIKQSQHLEQPKGTYLAEIDHSLKGEKSRQMSSNPP